MKPEKFEELKQHLTIFFQRGGQLSEEVAAFKQNIELYDAIAAESISRAERVRRFCHKTGYSKPTAYEFERNYIEWQAHISDAKQKFSDDLMLEMLAAAVDKARTSLEAAKKIKKGNPPPAFLKIYVEAVKNLAAYQQKQGKETAKMDWTAHTLPAVQLTSDIEAIQPEIINADFEEQND